MKVRIVYISDFEGKVYDEEPEADQGCEVVEKIISPHHVWKYTAEEIQAYKDTCHSSQRVIFLSQKVECVTEPSHK